MYGRRGGTAGAVSPTWNKAAAPGHVKLGVSPMASVKPSDWFGTRSRRALAKSHRFER